MRMIKFGMMISIVFSALMSCAPTGFPYLLYYDLYITNDSTNDVSVIAKVVHTGLENRINNQWNLITQTEWVELAESNRVFENTMDTYPNWLGSSYAHQAVGYNITEGGTAIGILYQNRTNYFISFEKVIAEKFYPEITNDTLIYGFAYLKYDDLNWRNTDSFRSDVIPGLLATNVNKAEYIINVSNDTMTLLVNFYTGVGFEEVKAKFSTNYVIP